MNHTAVGAGPGDSHSEGSARNVPLDNTSGTSTALHHGSLQTPPMPRSPMVFGVSPSHSKQNAVNTPRVNCLTEYLREERQSGPLSLDSHLFPGGLLPGAVVEVWGNSNCGKSMLTLTLIATALLPTVWKGIELGGCNTGVTLIDCDQHFSIFHLVSLMYKRVKAQLKIAKDTLSAHKEGKTTDIKPVCNVREFMDLLRTNKANLKTKIEEMVQGCLKSLYYIKCMESVQLPIVLASVDDHLAKNSDVSLVVVDSLSAFCWYDWVYRGGGKFVEMKKYYDKIFGALLANIKKHNVVLLAVKQALFLKSSEESSRKGQDEQEEEQEVLQEKRLLQDDENDMDMEEGDCMENMTESEYFGYAWVSSVTCQIIVSKMRVNPKGRSCVSHQCAVVAGTKDILQANDRNCESKEPLFSAAVTRGKQSTKLFFVIGDEGVLWRQVVHIT